MPNWITWNITVFIFKLPTYAKHNFFEIELFLTKKMFSDKSELFELELFD